MSRQQAGRVITASSGKLIAQELPTEPRAGILVFTWRLSPAVRNGQQRAGPRGSPGAGDAETDAPVPGDAETVAARPGLGGPFGSRRAQNFGYDGRVAGYDVYQSLFRCNVRDRRTHPPVRHPPARAAPGRRHAR